MSLIKKIVDSYKFGFFNILKNYIRIAPIKIDILLKLPRFSKEINNKVGRKIILDCGSNLGQGYEELSKYFPKEEFDVIFIEPNPNCMLVLKNKYTGDNYKFIEKAAWIENTQLKFYGTHENILSEGGSLINDHNNLKPTENNKFYIVNSFDFCDFISTLKEEYEQIVVKLDIESAEYDVLEKLIRTKLIKLVDLILIEFHSFTYSNNKKSNILEREKDILQKLKKLNVKYILWY